jgi:hypothetical protein
MASGGSWIIAITGPDFQPETMGTPNLKLQSRRNISVGWNRKFKDGAARRVRRIGAAATRPALKNHAEGANDNSPEQRSGTAGKSSPP